MKITNFIKGVFVFVLIAVMSFGAATNTKAAETKTSYLPEGWKSLYNDQGTGILKTDYQDVDVIQPRQPAPALTSLEIIDLAVDDNNEIHVVTREIGTSKWRFTYWNGDLCKENIYETQDLVGSDRIIYGYIRYYHTGVYYSSSLKGTTADVSARATNVHNPWNELTDSRRFVLP